MSVCNADIFVADDEKQTPFQRVLEQGGDQCKTIVCGLEL